MDETLKELAEKIGYFLEYADRESSYNGGPAYYPMSEKQYKELKELHDRYEAEVYAFKRVTGQVPRD